MHRSNNHFSTQLTLLSIDRKQNLFCRDSLSFWKNVPSLPLGLLARLPWSIGQKMAAKFFCILHLYDLKEQRNLAVSGCLGRRLGYTREEIQSMGVLAFASLLHPNDLVPVAEYYQRFSSLQAGETLEITYRMKRADGSYGWLRSRETPYLHSPDDPSYQLIGIVEEIAEGETTGSPALEAIEPENSSPSATEGWWIEIATGEDGGIYYLGPFADLREAECLYREYFETLPEGEIATTIEYGRPASLASELFQESSYRTVGVENQAQLWSTRDI